MFIYKNKDLIELKEEDLVKFFLNNFSQYFYKSFRLKSIYKPYLSYKHFPSAIGDLDLIMVNSRKPQSTIEFEFKKVKVKDDISSFESLNKLNGLKKGINQVKNRVKLGFHKVYFGILIVKQINNRYSQNISFIEASIKSLIKIEDSKDLKNIDRRAGVVLFQFTQSNVMNFNEGCGLSIQILRDAQPQRQTLDLTNRIVQLFC